MSEMKEGDEGKDSQRLVENIGHFVLKVLSRDERVQKIESVFALECHNLSARATDIRVDIEGLPQVVDTRRARHSTDIEENANIGLEDRTERVEEPSMTVNLLLILLLEAENQLDRNHALVRGIDLECRCDADLRRVLVDMGCHVLLANLGLQGHQLTRV